jgi:RES domain-containing protein
MILTPFRGSAFRFHVPKWSHTPLSGAGAGQHAGRANRIGVDALYLSLDLETASQEYKQTSVLLPPGLVVHYEVDVDQVVDFREGHDPSRWDPMWQDFFCDWRALYFNQRIQPPSWTIGDEVIASRAKGILFKSVHTQGTNLVLYMNEIAPPNCVSVYDPGHSLPKNQDSWE